MNSYSFPNRTRLAHLRVRSLGLALVALCLLPFTAPAAVYYVDSSSGGNDSHDGLSEVTAFRTVARVNSLSLLPGDAVLFRRGGNFDGTLSIGADGTEAAPIRVASWGSGERPILYGLDLSGDHLVIEDLVVDHRKDASDAVKMRGARHATLRRMTIRNGTRDAIDLSASDGLLVEDVEIHHFLNGSFGSKDDSHGVAITSTDGVTLRRVNIHHVSGDSVQADPNRIPGAIADNIVIEDSELWTGPLREDFNAGWQAGDSPGENAIDTKVLKSGYADEIRMNITLRNVLAHGWTSVPEISNRAAFNLKEKISAVLDRITVYNSEIAFRVRGGLGNADTLIMNTLVYDVVTAIRAEDDLQNLRLYNATFGNGITELLDFAGGDAGVPTWDWRNNAFLGSKPAAAADPTNIAAATADFIDAGSRDYRPSTDSRLVDAGVVIDAVSVDRDGKRRTAPYDVGAYEKNSTATKPKPPVLHAD